MKCCVYGIVKIMLRRVYETSQKSTYDRGKYLAERKRNEQWVRRLSHFPQLWKGKEHPAPKDCSNIRPQSSAHGATAGNSQREKLSSMQRPFSSPSNIHTAMLSDVTATKASDSVNIQASVPLIAA